MRDVRGEAARASEAPPVLWPTERQALEPAESAADGRALAAASTRSQPPAPSDLTSLFPVPCGRSGSRSASAPASISCGRQNGTPISASSAASLSSTGRALLGAIEDRGHRDHRVHDGDAREVLAWLPKGSIARASSSCFLIPGRRSAAKAKAPHPRDAVQRSPASWRQRASLGLRVTTSPMPARRFVPSREGGAFDGARAQRRLLGSGRRIGPRPVTSGRP